MTFRDGTLVDWRPWNQEAFDVADRAGKPVLACLTAPWCDWCERMDEETYSDPKLAANIGESFVPVRVDVDRNPRVRERYNMGGFPTTVFLTPGGEVLTGATYLGPDTMRGVLDSVRESWNAKGTAAGSIPRNLSDSNPPSGEVTADIEAHMVEQVAASFDDEYGGWGSGGKFPLPSTIEFALKRDRDRATRTLEAIRTHLQDTYDGGFYRFAESRNWGDPHREKLADENAGLVRAFTTGYLYTGEDAYETTAERAIDYLTTNLWTGEAFAGSQAADDDYYTMNPSDREEAEPPHVDETVFADRNGMAAEALLSFAAVTDHEGARRYAERALEHVLDTLVDNGRVAHHDAGDSETGLLADHARLLGGLTTAAQVTGPDGWLEPAEAVADEAIDRLVAADDSFLDGDPTGAGLLDRPLRPLETNAEMADALIDLWALTGEDRYMETATEALAAFAGAYDRMGVEVAGYAAACARAHYDPLVVRTPPAGTDLHRAALRIADHEKVVVPEDRDDAVVVRAGEETTPAETPDELLERAADGPAP